jgi:UDP-N-acetylenolpyruvoylglucosamine reductase
VRVLVEYLRAHPFACDTVDGISWWWIGEYGFSTTELMQALEQMKKQGLVEELAAADGRLRYRRCASDDQLRAAVDSADTGH